MAPAAVRGPARPARPCFVPVPVPARPPPPPLPSRRSPRASLTPPAPPSPPPAALALLAAALAGAAPSSRPGRTNSVHVAPAAALALTMRATPLRAAAAARLAAALRAAAPRGAARVLAVAGGAPVAAAARRLLAADGVLLHELPPPAGAKGGRARARAPAAAPPAPPAPPAARAGEAFARGDAPFRLVAPYQAAGSQPAAIDALVRRLRDRRFVTCAGATGVGKTFVAASVIAAVAKPTLVLAPNKLLAAQLCDELRQYFPTNQCSLFVSYYKHFQPESYMPASDTFIAKSSSIDADIDRLRHLATRSIVERRDVIIVASVSCIYGLGLPADYLRAAERLCVGDRVPGGAAALAARLERLRYADADGDGAARGQFRVRGPAAVDVGPPWERDGVVYSVELAGDVVARLSVARDGGAARQDVDRLSLYPATHHYATEASRAAAVDAIEKEKAETVRALLDAGSVLEARRLEERVDDDVAMLRKVGFCSGVENYSMHLTGRRPGDAPDTLLDFFPDGEWLLFVDESHVTLPQLGAMHAGNLSRKRQLVRHGFRLPSAVENRPLTAGEFWGKVRQAVFLSATPGKFELENSRACAAAALAAAPPSPAELAAAAAAPEDCGLSSGVVDAVIRPTAVLDPECEVVPSAGQVDHMLLQLARTAARGERAIVTTLTKKSAEDLAVHLRNRPPVAGVHDRTLRVSYLHSGIDTTGRMEVLDAMRSSPDAAPHRDDDGGAGGGDGDGDGGAVGYIDVLVGVNLLREGISLPSVALVCIVDADKEGFLRSTSALVQTIGRAARNVNGRVILYGDRVTGAMRAALGETARRRRLQQAHNARHGVTPTTAVSARALQDRADVETLLEQVRRVRLEEGRAVRGGGGRVGGGDGPRADGRRGMARVLDGRSPAELQVLMAAAVEAERFEEAGLVRDYLAKL